MEFISLTKSANGPRKIEDYLYFDEPPLGLHIVTFLDATLVSLSWPHTFLDAMGRKSLMEAWTLTLHGRDDEVAPLAGVLSDPFATLGDEPKEKYLHEKWLLKPWQMIVFGLRYAFEILSVKLESRLMCVPAALIKNIYETSLQELATEGDKTPFLSEGDVLCAWLTRLILSDSSPSSNQTVCIQNAYGIRALFKDRIPAGSAYVANAVMQVHTLLPMKDLFAKPISYVAAKIRRGIVELGTREQIDAFNALVKKLAKTRRMPLFGDGTMKLVIFSNWSKGKFFQTDFSPAVVKEGPASVSRENKIGRPSLIMNTSFSTGQKFSNIFAIVGKDTPGNYWVWCTLRSDTLAQVERMFKEKSQ
jgi:hypothetical protein